ncbi:hypothetical protein FACS1894139_05010 [Planctomycetales bacterium]|nr:hypothetical protein FACS1894107_03250 [Planctomycetales bacterium]GHS97044.1 hypothetical protein FACS1894108_02750 [Planctomycetales bacterium]GHT03834.1 hypothetical protein FACS1894139_05010 [Planctomycetales bacterium]
MPKRTVISNTSCLIALTNIGKLDLLQKRYGRVVITPEVKAEFGEPLPAWISVVAVKDELKTFLITKYLDLGEASTIALATEMANPLIILDDGKARRYAKNINLNLTGTLGILVKASEVGLITDIFAVLADLRKIQFRFPADFADEWLNQ